MQDWTKNAMFYHIYPLRYCDAPQNNDFATPPTPRINTIYNSIEHILSLGVNAIYLGPLFESSSHGYDTVDYFHLDRRLGRDEDLQKLVDTFHQKGIRVIVDAVFNHVGRDFWAFKDLQEKGKNSKYTNWFTGVNFNYKSPLGDAFTYDAWNGHYSLVKLNVLNPEVSEHIFHAVETWINRFHIDGLRLDAADCIEIKFLEKLSTRTKQIKSDFWLMGEVIHGDYRLWVNPQTLNSVTNYENFKSLYSSLNDKNLFEIAHSLKRQFGDIGIYKNFDLYNFADNHDVDRVATLIKTKEHLYPLYLLLFTIPGMPSIYYGSEFGFEGKRINGSDLPLRPTLKELNEMPHNNELFSFIQRLSFLRKNQPTLQMGTYKELLIKSEQFAFLRTYQNENALIVINSSNKSEKVVLTLPPTSATIAYDLLNKNDSFQIHNNKISIESLHPNWGRILVY